MAFATATPYKIGFYLGYPAVDGTADTIEAVLTSIESMTYTDYSTGAVTIIEGYISQLDTIATAINTQRGTEGSTLLPELRREYRRYCALLASSTGLEIYTDTSGSSLA